MSAASDPVLLALCAAGIAAGLAALWRGLRSQRTGSAVSSTGSSSIASLAAGEVRVSGVVEVAEVLLRSPLQDRECVWYRSRVIASDGGHASTTEEERGVGFRVRDASGSIRVFPRGARLDIPDRYDARTGLFGSLPEGLQAPGALTVVADTPAARAAAEAALLTVHQPVPTLLDRDGDGGIDDGDGRRFVEARLEPGDLITILGTARPFGEIEDPSAADALDATRDPYAALADPEIAADIEAARAHGALLTPEEAWGNAAIPGFGIGRPVREPVLDPAAARPALAPPEEAAAAERVFDLDPDLLVLASAPDAPLLVAWGAPGDVAARNEATFLLGLLGAVVAIVSALAGAMLLAGR